MSSLMIRMDRAATLANEDEARNALAGLAEALKAAAQPGRLWVRFRGVVLPFDGDTIDLVLAEDVLPDADEPGRATHLVSLTTSPEGTGEVGFAMLAVRPHASPGGAHGLIFSASLPVDAFNTSPDALRRLVERGVDAVDADAAVVGPRSWARELDAGWATFARRIHCEYLPEGAVVAPTRTGSLIIAHAEEPASESPAAREAIARVRIAVRGELPSTPVAPPLSPDVATQAVALSQPSYLATPSVAPMPPPHGPAQPFTMGTPYAPLPRPLRVPSPLSATADPVPASRPALPFAERAGSDSTSTASVSRAVRAPAHLSGTAPIVDAPSAPVLPFSASTCCAPPELTLEQYASLRAHLTVRGEEDQETWRDFGVRSRAAKEALQSRFAARFRQDAAAQARFVELVRWHVDDLRAKLTYR